MKSLKKYFTVMLFAMMGFMAYAADSKVDYVALGTEFTPENSVVMIFVGYYGNSDFYQINPEFPPNHFQVKEASGCTVPLVPGSCYVKASSDMSGSWTGSPSIVYSLPIIYLNKEQDDKWQLGLKVTVPSEPGLYVYYAHLDMESMKDRAYIMIGDPDADPHESRFICNRMVKYFQNSAKLYEGTPWEPLINEYVKEWTYEKK